MGGFKLITDAQSNDLVDIDSTIYTTFNWDIPELFANVPTKGLNVVTKAITLLLKDATTPTFTAAKESYISASLEYKFAKSVTWDDIKLTWYDTGMISHIRQWRESVWTENNGLAPASNYKKRTKLRCFTPSVDEHFGWILYGSWPSSIRSGDLTYTSSDAKIVEVTVTYDYAEERTGVNLNFNPVSGIQY